MGKPTGFLEYKRELPPERSVEERIKDWAELYTHSDNESLQKQGARCMNCGVPFCHTGAVVGGMAMGCPLNNLIPEWNDLIWRGRYNEAYNRLIKTNCFPEFTGRVCPAPCEGSCTLGMHDPAVTIKNIERHIIDTAFEEGCVQPEIPMEKKGKSVAVVGSGPAGLAAAYRLNQKGYGVTVFERNDRAGGLLMYGIPNMKLDKNVVQRRVELMEQEGVHFEYGVEIGTEENSAKKLLAKFDAVALCIGSTVPRALTVEGAELDGVHFALDFLSDSTKSLLDSDFVDGDYINAKDKDVVIVGGGDTGTDCVATAIRHGCKSVVQLEIMPELPDMRTTSNPWPEYPKIKKTDYGHAEAIHVFGKDPREYLTTVTRFEGKNGCVTAVHTVKVEWTEGTDGRMIPIPVKESESVRRADMVLVAMGFVGAERSIADELGLKTDSRNTIVADEKTHRTNVKGVFAAGDCRRGQSLVVWGIREGIETADAIEEYLDSSEQ